MNLQTLAGLVCTDGSFSVSFSKRKVDTYPFVQTSISFSVSQSTLEPADEKMLYMLKEYFDNKGSITIDTNPITGRSNWAVKSWRYIYSNILPVFEENKLMGSKARDLIIIKEICTKMVNKEHSSKNRQGIYEIMILSLALHPETRVKDHTLGLLAIWFTEEERASFALSFSGKYEQFVKEANAISLTQRNMDPDFISGLILGDGCFHIRLSSKGEFLFQLKFGQSGASDILCKTVWDFFSSTDTRNRPSEDSEDYDEIDIKSYREIVISASESLKHQVIPHFDRYPLWGRKANTFQKWKTLFFAVQRGEHLTFTGYLKIAKESWVLNREGSKRRLDFNSLIAKVLKYKGWSGS